MATIEDAVFAHMTGHAGLAALVALRIYPLVIPPDVAMPAIAYQKISSPKQHNHQGSSNLARSLFQFTIGADDYTTAKYVAVQIRACWAGYRGTVATVRIDGALVDDERDDWSENHAAPAARVDVAIWHYE